MKQEHINEIKAIVVLALGMILLASLISFVPDDLPWYTSQVNQPTQNLIRITGAYISGSLMFVFGLSAYGIVVFLFLWSWNKFTSRDIHFSVSKFFSFLVLFCVLSSFFSMFGSQEAIFKFQRAGIVGLVLSDFLLKYCGLIGSYILLSMLGMLALILTGEFLVTPHFLKAFQLFGALAVSLKRMGEQKRNEINRIKPKINLGGIGKKKAVKQEIKEIIAAHGNDDIADEDEQGQDGFSGKPRIKIAKEDRVKTSLPEKPLVIGDYKIPSLDLLDDPPNLATSKIENDLISGAKLLESTLANFGVSARVADIERGPAITRYELEPAPGVKVQKFTTLSDDIALAMKAPTVRIVAPIPGKDRVGIEVPNGSSAAVFLKDVLSSSEFQNAESKLTLSLGKDIAGKSMVADLCDMPHLLIAGTTGSGKTVCVNGIIMSILLNATPDEVKFVMVDPKMVELAQYNDIPHLLCPTVTDAKKASGVLLWVVTEMENRYKQLSKAGVRNIKGFNEQGNTMPYIVVIIDELADLMQVSAKGVESSITRLAQLSRAVGIHLILATQRPSVNVITGVIKANFPARISFKVASKIDSRTVLDMNGAESLLGKGDMLFMKPGDAKPTRGQGNFVKDAEINRVIEFIKQQRDPTYDEGILNTQRSVAMGGSEEKDEYYDEAVRLVVETNQASVSIIQRRMRLGYTRAARLIDMMEQNGVVGPYAGSKAREILVDRESWLLENLAEGEDNGG